MMFIESKHNKTDEESRGKLLKASNQNAWQRYAHGRHRRPSNTLFFLSWRLIEQEEGMVRPLGSLLVLVRVRTSLTATSG